MASLALGAVGAGIGSAFGYASLGWSIGSALGSYLFAPDGPDIEGPRLDDKSVTTSAYGNMRPLIYGSYRVGGEVIWSSDLIEHAHKEEQGKGGGGGSYTTYTYTISFGLAVATGPITGIRKIWFNSELIYSVADDASMAEIKTSNEKAQGFRVYTGTETQTADPTYQTLVGATNAPAYRGTAYIVWNNLDVTKYGGIPQITVEVVQNGTESISSKDTLPGILQTSLRQIVHFGDGVAYVFNAGGSAPGIESFDIKTYSLSSNTLLNTNYYYYDSAGSEASGVFRFLATESVSPSGNIGVIEAGDFGSGNNRRWWLISLNDIVTFIPFQLQMDTDLDNFRNGQDVSFNIRWQKIDGIDAYLWFYKSNSGQVYRYALPLPLGSTISQKDNEVFQVDSSRDGLDPNTAWCTWALDEPNDEFYVKIKDAGTSATSIKRYDSDGNLIETKFSSTDELVPFAVSNGKLWDTNGSSTLRIYDWSSETLLFSQTISNLVNITDTDSSFVVSGNALLILSAGTIYRFVLSMTNDGYSLDQVVDDVCNRVGLDDSEIDVTELSSDTVRGFLISKQVSARSALEQLSAAYFFDGRESDGVLEFVKRGGSSIATLSDDDLGCYEGDNVIEVAEITRTQEEELPKALTVRYADINADYQTGAQHALRQSVLEGTEVTVELPMALTGSEGRDIVDTMMYSVWENRNKYKLSTWQKYHKIDPADIITATGETMRVINRNEGVNGLIEIEAVRELAAIYTGQVGDGVASGISNQTVEIGGPTIFHLLDIPPLRDNDYDDYGIYFAADGYLDDWTGAVALRSPDGTTFETKETTNTGAAIGQATTVLADWAGDNTFDETNVVRVQVSDTLETKTESEVLNGANLALVGDELIQFKNASLVISGVYDLSGMLRGRMGTTWAMSSHAINERFVLLSNDSARFVSLPTQDLNTARTWAALTLGKTIEYAQRTTLTYTGNNLKPIAPVHIGGGTTGTSTAWTIQWMRSTRYRWKWNDFVTGGNDESSFNFEVRIYNSAESPSTVLRTITVNNATASGGFFSTTYSNADQITDFGAYQYRLAVSIRQVGATRNSEWSDITVIHSGGPSSTVLLMHMDGADASTTFTDEMGNVATVYADAKISTAQSKFGGASGYFDGTGDHITFPSGSSLQFPTQNFTIEAFVRVAGTGVYGICGRRSVTNAIGFVFQITANKLRFACGDSNTSAWEVEIVGTAAVAANTWTHVAVTRSGSTFRIFVNGVLDASATWGGSIADQSSVLAIGANDSVNPASPASPFNGYIDELRIKKDEAIYTANFTPPSAPFTE